MVFCTPPSHRRHADHTKELYPLIWQCAGANTSRESSCCDKPEKMGNTRQHCFSDNDRKTSGMRKYSKVWPGWTAIHIFSSRHIRGDDIRQSSTYHQIQWNFISQGALKDMQCPLHIMSFALCTLAVHVKPSVSLLDNFALCSPVQLVYCPVFNFGAACIVL